MPNVNAKIETLVAIKHTAKVLMKLIINCSLIKYYIHQFERLFYQPPLFYSGYHSLNRAYVPGKGPDFVTGKALLAMTSKDYPITSAPNSIRVKRHNRRYYQSYIGTLYLLIMVLNEMIF